MLGIEDPSIWSAYLLCILSTLLCFTYGASKWNKGEETTSPQDITWMKDEKEMEEKL